MIDYDKQDDDPTIAEVRRAREQYAARFDYDLNAIFADILQRQATSGRQYLTSPPRPAQPPPATKKAD